MPARTPLSVVAHHPLLLLLVSLLVVLLPSSSSRCSLASAAGTICRARWGRGLAGALPRRLRPRPWLPLLLARVLPRSWFSSAAGSHLAMQ